MATINQSPSIRREPDTRASDKKMTVKRELKVGMPEDWSEVWTDDGPLLKSLQVVE